MSYNLVSDFLINPVLRQARRFSRSAPNTTEDIGTTLAISEPRNDNGFAIDDIVEGLASLPTPALVHESSTGTISDAPLTSSPIEEDGGLGVGLGAIQESHILSGSSSYSSSTRPLRVASLNLESGQVDNDVSDNPSYGVPNRFRTNSRGTTSPVEGSSRQATLDTLESNTHRTTLLPADDGMGALRQQIIFIQSMDVSASQKARLMHELLTRGYARAQEVFNATHQPIEPSRADMISQERPTTPGSLSSFLWQMNGSPDPAVPDQQYTFHLSPSDLEPTYAPPEIPEIDEDGDINVEDVEPILGCRHYKRNVKLQCVTCEKWYTCRLCHDEAEDHILNRKATKNMLCMICGCAQRASEFCVGCGERTAWYYCGVCKLWDNDPNKSIYHCNDCGICRKGRGLGKDFFHCKTCGTCMSMAVEKSHKCIERVSDCDCPICGEYMFTSPSPVVFMLCGHGIHKACYDEHMKSSYKCPICSKSTVNMETQFRNLDRAIDSQPMPPQFQDTKAMVSCNDCYAKSAVKYHWLGLKCAICDSYNTAQLSILSDPAVEVPPLESRESESVTPQEQSNVDGLASGSHNNGLARQRRHSVHVLPSVPQETIRRFSPYIRPVRFGRSVSPVREFGFFSSLIENQTTETESSADEDELDFWGGDERRSMTSAEVIDETMEDGSDEDSGLDDDCEDDDDDGDEGEDEFALFGHR